MLRLTPRRPATALVLLAAVMIFAPLARADYTSAVSPVGPLDGIDPLAAFTSYPPDSLEEESDFPIAYTLSDMIADSLTVQLFLEEAEGGETTLIEGMLATGGHEHITSFATGDWRLGLRVRDDFGNESETVGAYFVVFTTGLEAPGTPGDFALFEASPNPFNPMTTLTFTLPAADSVNLTVFNLQGGVARILVDARMPAGRHQTILDGADLPSGVYVARLCTSSKSRAIKLTLLK